MLARAAIALALLAAALFAFRLGWADLCFRYGGEAGVRHAARLLPGNAAYALRLGNLREAVRLNPRLARAWIELGLAAESAGDQGEAERALLQAAEVDRTYEPHWTLANYYFRNRKWPRFWDHAQQALALSYGDRTALFRLCRQAPDGNERLRSILPALGPLASDYLRFLLAEGDLAEAELHSTNVDDGAPLLELADRLLEAGQVEPAVEVWNRVAAQPLAPGKGPHVTNGDWRVPPSHRGFDWHMPPREGVFARRDPGSPGLRITLDGRQYERTEMMWQFAPVEDQRRYVISSICSNSDMPTGVRWEVSFPGKAVAVHCPVTGSAVFRSQGRLLRLSLVYERPPGSRKLEGTFELRKVDIIKVEEEAVSAGRPLSSPTRPPR
jgi:hypothetical protein